MRVDANACSRWITPVAWGVGLIMTAAFLGAHFSTVPARQVLFDNLQWTVADVGAVVLAGLGYCRASDADRDTRRWFVWGLSSTVVGQLLWDWQIYTGWTPVPAPSDLFYPACGLFIAIGLWKALARRVSARRLRELSLDVSILLIQILAIILIMYLARMPDIAALQLMQLAVYPIVMFGSVIVGLVMALALGLRSDWRWQLLLAGLVLTGIAWMRWNIIDIQGTPANGTWLNYSFAVASLLRGLGAAHWDVVRAEPDAVQDHHAAFFLLLPMVMVMAAVTTVAMVWDAVQLPGALRVAVVLGSAAVIVLSVIRQGLLLRERERLLQAERRVVEKEQQYRVLAQRLELATSAAHLGIWDIDLTRHKTAIWEERMYALCGYPGEQDKAPYEIWDQAVHPDDIYRARLVYEQAMESHGDFELEFRIVTATGELRYLEAYGVIQRNAADQPIRMTGVAWDVTERVIARRALAESEAELSAIFENSVLGIVLADQERKILRSNRAARELLGYSASQAAAILVEDIMHPSEREVSRQLFNSLLAGERDTYQQEKRYLRGDGQYMWVRITVYPVLLKEARNFVCLIEDISPRKQAEEHLHEVQRRELRVREEFSQQLLNAQEQERQRIANELHDGLGQNLSVIKNRAQLALEESGGTTPVDAQLQGILRVTTDAIAEVRGLVQNLRPMHIEQLGLTAALGQLLEQFAEASQLQLISRLEDIDDAFLPEQVTHIYRLVQEVLNNIGKHARAQQVQVRIERDLHSVRIGISDDGAGFEVSHAMQAGGLGLHSMTERVHMLGGEIHIRSSIGAGSSVLIELPSVTTDDEPGLTADHST